MAAPITSEASQFSHTTFLEPAICRPRQGIAPPPLNPRPIWHNEDPQEHIKVPSVGPPLFEGDYFVGRSYSSSFLRSSADHHSNNQCLPPPTEPSPPPPYLEFGSMQPYAETPQYYPTSTNLHTSSGSPTFPLRPSDDWSLPRTPSLSSSQGSFWGPSHNVLAGVSELSHRRSYSTISSDAVSTPTLEPDSQISPVSSDAPWDRLIEVPALHRAQHVPSPKSRTPIAPWINENVDGASLARLPVHTPRLRATQACQKCRMRKAKVCSVLIRLMVAEPNRVVNSVTARGHVRGA